MNILLSGTRAPSALHVARLLHDGGATVVAADSLRFPLTRGSPFVATTLRYPAPRFEPDAFAAWLGDVIDRHRIDLIFPTCEEVFHLAFALARLGQPELLFAPSLPELLACHHKHAFAQTIVRLGLPAPRTRLLTSPEDLGRIVNEVANLVLKPALSRFGARTLIQPDAEDLARICPSPRDPWVAQDYLEGPEVCIYAMGAQGRVTALAAYHPRHRAGRGGAGVYFEPVRTGDVASAVRDFAERFFARTAWHGQAAFDAILTPDSGLLPIECNPRTTSGVHFFTDGPGFVAALLGRGEARAGAAPLHVGPAMWTYGLRAALGRPGGAARWWHDLRHAGSALAYGRGRLWGTMACTAEIASSAIRLRQSLIEASTWDIEWNSVT